MSLFPNLEPEYYNENHKDILKRMEKFYTDSISINQSFWSEADIDTRFEAGDQSLWNQLYGNLPAATRKTFNFNRIRRIINMVSGHQRRNRKSIIVVPVENGDEVTSDQFTKIILWAIQQENILETVSEAFHGALVTGMNLLQIWLDYRSDPISGNIKVDNCSYNSFLIDPYFKKADLSDCNGIWKRSFLTPIECASLVPDKREIIMGLPSNYGSKSGGKFQFMPESYNYGMQNLLTYDEFYYKAYRPQKMLVDTESGESIEWRIEDEDGLKNFLNMYPQIEVLTQDVPSVKLAIVIQGRVVYDGVNPLGIDKYPFVPVLGYYSPQMPYFPWRIQGMVRNLRDSQFLYNRRRVIELDILESQINSGWIYKEDALVNSNDVFLSGQGKGLALKSEAQMTDVMKIPPADLAPGAMQLTELLAREPMEISGVNEELIGSAVDDKAGVLSMLRQGAGLTTLQVLFDQLDRSQKLLGKLMIDIIQNNFTPGKIARIIEEDPTDQFFNKSFGRYDAAIEDGINTTTQRQMQFAQMLQLKEVGVPITDEDILEAATLQNKSKLIENMQKRQQQAAQQEQQQMQVQQQLQEAQMKAFDAKAKADTGLYVERVSRVEENRALAIERIAEANKDDEMAVLNKIRAVKELEDIDISQLERLVSLVAMLKAGEGEAKENLESQAESKGASENLASPSSQNAESGMNGSLPPVQ